MAYPTLPAGRYGVGAPIDIADGASLWQGSDKTNGFLMRSVDGRIPSLEEGFANAVASAANPLFDDGLIPWGNALWLDVARIDTQPHTMHAESPAAPRLTGVLKFNQGVRTGNPVQNWGLPLYSKGTVIRDGLVGYKVAMEKDADPEDYLAYLKGDASKDASAVRLTYADWMEQYKAQAQGVEMGLFFENASGFPAVIFVDRSSVTALAGTPGATYSQGDFTSVRASGVVAVAGFTFGGWAKVFEPENQAVYFEIKL